MTGVLDEPDELEGVLCGLVELEGVLCGLLELDELFCGLLEGVLWGLLELEGVLCGLLELEGVLCGLLELDGLFCGSPELEEPLCDTPEELDELLSDVDPLFGSFSLRSPSGSLSAGRAYMYGSLLLFGILLSFFSEAALQPARRKQAMSRSDNFFIRSSFHRGLFLYYILFY